MVEAGIVNSEFLCEYHTTQGFPATGRAITFVPSHVAGAFYDGAEPLLEFLQERIEIENDAETASN
jgi:hypothetical protein